MSRKMTSKCDGCGVEVVENDDAMPTGILGVMRRRHGSDRWGSLNVATGGFPAMFDLCEKCTARVVALLELEMPKPPDAMHGHATLFPGGYIPNDLSQHLRSIGVDDSAFGAAMPLCPHCGEPFDARTGFVCPKCKR